MPTRYQIAAYPFELTLEQSRTPAEDALLPTLDTILRAFRLNGQTPPAAAHPVTEVDTLCGRLRCAAEAGCPRLTLQPDDRALHADVIELVDAFEPEIVNQAIRESPGHLWIHGACLLRDGAMTLLVAQSGTGKTTLSLGLLHHGYRLVTDDIILISLETQHVIPVPRCPKFRRPADQYLREIGFDLEKEARLIQRYVLLPLDRLHRAPVPLPIRRVFLLSRDPQRPPQVQPLDTTSGILGLLPQSNLMGHDPTLTLAHQLFAETRFFQMNLCHYAEDLRVIAG